METVPEEDETVDAEYQFVMANEELLLTSLQLRQRRQVNEKLITAVRQLYAERELTSLQAKFWEGALGHLKHKPVTQAGLKQALHRETSTFVAVYLRQQLYEAMFHRDVPLMNKLIGKP
jgi:tRNA A37 N6-isopentenylltransferase MiaA